MLAASVAGTDRLNRAGLLAVTDGNDAVGHAHDFIGYVDKWHTALGTVNFAKHLMRHRLDANGDRHFVVGSTNTIHTIAKL